MRKMKKMFLGLLLIAAVFGARDIISQNFPIKDLNSRVVRTQYDMFCIAGSIKQAVKGKGTEPPETMNELKDCLRKYALIDSPHDEPLRDRWGTPYIFNYIQTDNYTIISCGRNKRYENGEGDDLVESFDPFELLKKISNDPDKGSGIERAK